MRLRRIRPKPLDLCASTATATVTKWLRLWGFEPGGLGFFVSLRLSAKKTSSTSIGTAQQVAIRVDYRTAKPVQHGPCALVVIQAEHALQFKGTNALLLMGDVPGRSEPQPQ